MRPRYTEAIIAPTPNSAGIAAKPSLPDLVLSITDQVANAQTHADDHSAIRSWFLEVIQRFSLSSAEPGLAIHPIVSKCRIRADDAMTATGRLRNVRSAARKLPVGFRQRWSCSDRLNVAIWWKADVAVGFRFATARGRLER